MAEDPEFFKLTIDGLSAVLHVVRFRGEEGISELFEFEVDFVSDDAAIDFEAVVGKPALLEMTTNDDARFVHGIVSRFEETGVGTKFTNYSARIVPALWAFGLKNDCCIFQELSVPDVIKDVLQSGGLESGGDFDLRLKGSYPVREYIVQYRETDLDFVTRLMEEVGIFYFFEHTEDGHVLVLGDETGAHADIGGPVVLPFRAEDTGLQSDKEEVSRLRFTRTMRTGTTSMRSFNFEKNKLKLETASKADVETQHEYYDFDGRYGDEALGKALAKVRLEAFTARRKVVTGASNCRHLMSGFKFGVSEHPRDEFNADYMLTRVLHAGEQPQAAGGEASGGEAGGKSYANTFEAIPAAVIFRALQLTERALVDGPQTAVVTGPSGEEIYCDAHGRVKVQFHWDRYGKPDDKSSCWMRVSQSHRIADLAIPRVGEEVIVDFLEGDPDQPIITGRVYNGTNQTPYSLPGEKTKSTFKTPTSPGGGGFNELRFEDASGSEEVFLHAQKDWNIKVLNDRTQDIGHDHAHTVGHDEKMEVKNDRARKVASNEKITIGANQNVTIGANRTESVGANENVSITANRSITVAGSDTETVALQRTVSVGVNETLSVGGAREVTVGGAQAITVGAQQSTTIGGNETAEIGGNSSAKIGGDSNTDITGSENVKIGKKLVVDAADEISLKCGDASITLKKSGDIEIKGSKISIKGSGDVQIKGSKIAQN